jgi:hypothetical protein
MSVQRHPGGIRGRRGFTTGLQAGGRAGHGRCGGRCRGGPTPADRRGQAAERAEPVCGPAGLSDEAVVLGVGEQVADMLAGDVIVHVGVHAGESGLRSPIAHRDNHLPCASGPTYLRDSPYSGGVIFSAWATVGCPACS